MLESTHAVERDAARDSLSEFTLDRFLTHFDQMSPQARAVTGALVRGVDAAAIDRIRAELLDPARGRRKRALELAAALDAVDFLHTAIAALVKDEDQYLRIDAIRTLALHDCDRTRQVLRDAMLDTQPLVQQAAEAALRDLTRRTTARQTTSESDIRLTVLVSAMTATTPAVEVPA